MDRFGFAALGGPEEIRTLDPYNANVVRSRTVSYNIMNINSGPLITLQFVMDYSLYNNIYYANVQKRQALK